jgi:hypothetical protein
MKQREAFEIGFPLSLAIHSKENTRIMNEK